MCPGVKPRNELFLFVRWEAIPENRANSERMVPGMDNWIVLSANSRKESRRTSNDNCLLQYNEYRRQVTSESKRYVL